MDSLRQGIMRKPSIWIIFALSCILPGCASGPLRPNLVPLGQHDFTFLRSREPISVINNQKIKISEMQCPEHSYCPKADLNSWCDQSIVLITQWLYYNKIPITTNAKKKLYVSVLNPTINDRGSVTLDLKIETASGIDKTFSSEATAAGASRAVGYAINWGVVKVIHDVDILYYMEQ